MPARDAARLRAAPRLRAAWLAFACAAALGAGACDNPNEMFTGRWEADQAHDGVITGAPIVAMGHYGREVAGVVYFDLFPGGPPVEACPCAFIDRPEVDLDAREVEFDTTCPGAVPQRWQLTLEERGDDLVLVGTVRPADGSPDEVSVELVNKARFVGDEDKECPTDGS
ncbi:MAG: hypothetical protein ACQEXJ_03620 [Myxococcota bacterium]